MKKFIVAVLLVLPFGLFAQDKLGYINTGELITQMPEYTENQKALEELAKQYEDELLKMREEYYNKIKDFQDNQANLPDAVKEARQSEILELEQRITTFQNTANTGIQQKQESLFAPLFEKVRTAISEVGKENGFTYIFDLSTQAIVFQSDKAQNVLPLVKAKLGLN